MERSTDKQTNKKWRGGEGRGGEGGRGSWNLWS